MSYWGGGKNEKRLFRLRKNATATMVIVFVSFLFFYAILISSLSNRDILHTYGLVYFFIMFSIPFLLFLSNYCNRHIKILNPIINYCGRYSLQIYLLHIAFIKISFLPVFPGNKNIIVFLGFVMSILAAPLLQRVSHPICKLMTK